MWGSFSYPHLSSPKHHSANDDKEFRYMNLLSTSYQMSWHWIGFFWNSRKTTEYWQVPSQNMCRACLHTVLYRPAEHSRPNFPFLRLARSHSMLYCSALRPRTNWHPKETVRGDRMLPNQPWHGCAPIRLSDCLRCLAAAAPQWHLCLHPPPPLPGRGHPLAGMGAEFFFDGY